MKPLLKSVVQLLPNPDLDTDVVDIALQYNDSYSDQIMPTRILFTISKGYSLSGFRTANCDQQLRQAE